MPIHSIPPEAIAAFSRHFVSLEHNPSTICWIWRWERNGGGYGRVPVTRGKRRTWLAHRIAWMLDHDSDVPTGRIICHRCDTPPCVNPAHLYAGTYRQNMADRVKRQRNATYRRFSPQQIAKLADLLEIDPVKLELAVEFSLI